MALALKRGKTMTKFYCNNVIKNDYYSNHGYGASHGSGSSCPGYNLAYGHADGQGDDCGSVSGIFFT